MKNKLTIIPEDRFLQAIKALKKSTGVCPSCGKLVTATDHPYCFDKENNDIIYIATCPECGAPMCSHD